MLVKFININKKEIHISSGLNIKMPEGGGYGRK